MSTKREQEPEPSFFRRPYGKTVAAAMFAVWVGVFVYVTWLVAPR